MDQKKMGAFLKQLRKDKMFIRKLLAVTISGILAWGVSLILLIRFVTEVRGVEYLLGGALFGILFYSIEAFSIKANRTADGYLTSLIGAFAALIASNLLLFLLFFGTGTYHNYGLAGFYYTIAVFVFTFAVSGAITTVLNKRRAQKESAK